MAGKPGMHSRHLAEDAVGEHYREKLRAKINSTKLVQALIDHISGKREMSQTQVQAAMGLLRKTLPDLTATEVKATVVSYLDALRSMGKVGEQQVPAPIVRSNTEDTDVPTVH